MQKSSLPDPSLNGGLFSGEPFQKGAGWANVPIVPDSGYMIHYALESAGAPPGAKFQYPGGGKRPGNNHTMWSGVTTAPMYGLLVNQGPCASKPAPANCKCRKCTLPGSTAFW